MNDRQRKFFIPYPRRRVIRFLLHHLSRPVFALLSNLKITGLENLPPQGPLLIVANHFSFIDPPALVRLTPWPLEFIGGAQPPHAPKISLIVPWLWDYLRVYRGTGSTEALKGAASVLKQGGVVATFPEGGNWAEVLRPARPGTAFLAVQTQVPLLPVALSGFTQVFPTLKTGHRAKVMITIGKPFGPFSVSGKGRERRVQLEAIGHRIMEAISELLPPEFRGHYSDDPLIREAAKGTEIYPWANKVEGEVRGEIR
ncbi:MAG: lysophospholipid acyltransferase family protein [Thermodesulfobacteriota bacterium]